MKLPPKARAIHKNQGQLPVRCYRIHKTGKSINILMRPSQAIEIAANIMRKVQLLVDEGKTSEGIVKLWSLDGKNVNFGMGLMNERGSKKSHN